ncbi:hypothetical protein ILUMI_07121 [Ignelater luminosus]|uniref:Tetraspanin n=1 Tax=Ignelater luminosus TaxID=2038154 RepID=A0A8K0GIC6_IGNLU|nr:hypothetical protein ILUMI_07121 [Ignelater luminosus]
MARTKKLNLGLARIKRTLFVIITVLFLIGILLTAMGSMFHAVYTEFEVFIESRYFKPVAFLIMIGVFMILISILGFYGMLKTSTAITHLFSFCLVLLLILEVATAVIGFTFCYSMYDNVKSNMNHTLKQYNECYAARKSWGFLQSRLDCCGIESPLDWASEDINGTLITYRQTTFAVPESCLESSISLNHPKLYERGCINVLGNYMSDSIVSITCCVTIVLIVQVSNLKF